MERKKAIEKAYRGDMAKSTAITKLKNGRIFGLKRFKFIVIEFGR